MAEETPSGPLAAAASNPYQALAERRQAELERAQEQLMQQSQRMIDALGARKPAMDPFWAAMATGFSDPKAPSFFEGAGNMVKNYAALKKEQEADEINRLKLQMELQAKNVGMLQQLGGQAYMQSLRAPRPAAGPVAGPGAPATAAPVGGAPMPAAEPSMGMPSGSEAPISMPAGAAPAPVPGMAMAAGPQQRPPALPSPAQVIEMPLITDAQIEGAAAFGSDFQERVRKLADFQRQARETEFKEREVRVKEIEAARGRFKVSAEGVFDTETGQFAKIDPYNLRIIETRLPLLPEPVKLPETYARKAFELGKDPSSRAALIAFYESIGVLQPRTPAAPAPETSASASVSPGAPSTTKPAAPVDLNRPEFLSPEERARRAKIQEGRTTALEDEAKQLAVKAATAREMIPKLNQINELAKSNPRAFEVLQQPTIAEAFGRALKNGIQVPFGTFKIENAEEFAQALANIDPKDRQAIQLIAQPLAELNLAFAQTFMKGQGAVSNMERDLVSAASIPKTDSPTVMQMKASILKMRSAFNIEANKLWNESRKDYSKDFGDFLESKPYRDLVKHYDESLAGLQKQFASVLRTAPASPSKPRTLSEQLNQRLGS